MDAPDRITGILVIGPEIHYPVSTTINTGKGANWTELGQRPSASLVQNLQLVSRKF
jgi:hypothetical protein